MHGKPGVANRLIEMTKGREKSQQLKPFIVLVKPVPLRHSDFDFFWCTRYVTESKSSFSAAKMSNLRPLHLVCKKAGFRAKKWDFSKKPGFQQKNRISGSFFMDFTVGARGRLELQKSGISDISEIQLFCTKSLFFAQNPGFLRKQMAKNLDFRVHTVGAHRNPGFLSVGG